MAIHMQGTWTVTVRSAEGSGEDKRFIISGAAIGDGIYPASPGSRPVRVSGAHWFIGLQRRRGRGHVGLPDQVSFPVVSGGEYHVDVRVDAPEAGGGGVVLRCSAPVTATDFLLYGQVSAYRESCLFNPAHRDQLVIDTPPALAVALRHPALRAPLEQLYPERMRLQVPPAVHPPPFVPLIIPLRDQTALPAQVAQLLRGSATDEPVSLRSVTLPRASAPVIEFDRASVSGLAHHLLRRIELEPLPGAALRFQHYHRTITELTGGAYTGMGERQTLGRCVSDRNGRYVFRFSRALAPPRGVPIPGAEGEDVLAQVLPDLVVTAAAHPGGGLEGAPHWSVPFFQRVDVCVPLRALGAEMLDEEEQAAAAQISIQDL
ncbi:MAG TPA: hypothetical protein VND93_23200 [Myxococcales bacterium]|nr:hypothetical protein [Myxococcales bacterium]